MRTINNLSVKITAIFFLIGAFCLSVVSLPWYIPIVIIGGMYFLVRNVVICIRTWILDNLTIEEDS